MKILVVCQYFYPENFQINDICAQLAEDGNEVTVLTGRPNYPSGVVAPEYKKGHREECINGARVIRCFEIGRGRGALRLGLNYLSFCLSATRFVRKLDHDFDVVFVYQLSPIFMGLPGCKYAGKNHVPLFLYCCDLWPESIKLYFKNEKNLLFRVIQRISAHVYSSCARIACQSNSFLPYLREVHAIPEDKLTYLPAFADERYLHETFSLDNNIVDFVFLGNLGMAQNLMSVLKAVERIRDMPGFQVHFVGEGSCLEAMKAFVQKKSLEQIVRFYGRRPVEEMPEFYRLADICLVSLKADNQTGLTLPSKVQGYMAAGKPVLGMIDGSAREVIEASGCGLCAAADDVAGFAEAMRDFIVHPGRYRDCGENGRTYFKEHFRKSVFMEGLYRELDRVRGQEHVTVSG